MQVSIGSGVIVIAIAPVKTAAQSHEQVGLKFNRCAQPESIQNTLFPIALVEEYREIITRCQQTFAGHYIMISIGGTVADTQGPAPAIHLDRDYESQSIETKHPIGKVATFIPALKRGVLIEMIILQAESQRRLPSKR